MKVEGKTALITGAASGIGLETARRFAQDPKYSHIYALDIDPLIYSIFPENDFPGVVAGELDVANQSQVRGLMSWVALESGRLDVIVNAAGVMYKGKMNMQSPEVDRMWDVNFVAPMFMIGASRELMEDGGGGVVVNISSSKYLFPDIYHVDYQRSKKRLSYTTGVIRNSWQRDHNIRLIDILPGNTKTNIDRGLWTSGFEENEKTTVENIADWWKNTFGNNPKDVADKIYRAAEGEIKGSPIYVGWDAILGRAAYLMTYPLLGFRSDIMFFAGSTLFYKAAALVNKYQTSNHGN